MDADRFDALTRLLGSRTSRRVALGLVATGMLTIAVPEADAARCSRKRPCRECKRCNRRGRCRRKKNGTICSTGICQRGSCIAAPHQGICTAQQDYCAGDSEVQCGTSNGDCHCVVRPNGRSFCADTVFYCTTDPCTSDIECVARTGDVAAVCLTGGSCECPFLGVDTVCKVPCPNPR